MSFSRQEITNIAKQNSIRFGNALGIAISFATNKSIAWAILHGILGWFYVAYYLIRDLITQIQGVPSI